MTDGKGTPHAAPQRRAVFLDRDGVLNEDLGYVGQPERFHVFPYVGPALRLFVEKGLLLFIVTNQSGIERGYYTMEDTRHLHALLSAQMQAHGVQFTDIFVAPHHPDTPNDVRKPSPKFVLEAAARYHLDLASSYVIGDRDTDLEMGRRAGCKVILVRSGNGRETEKMPGIRFDGVFENLLEAAQSLT